MTSDDLIRAARDCLGTPFHHQGRQPGVGLDCGGLLVVALRAVGVDPIDMAGYARRPHGGTLERLLDSQSFLVRVAIQERAVADVLLMRFGAEPQHLALLTGETIIHAWEAVGKVVEHRLDGRWLRHVVRVYRPLGLSA